VSPLARALHFDKHSEIEYRVYKLPPEDRGHFYFYFLRAQFERTQNAFLPFEYELLVGIL
jgi:hypothetical protein